jgi:hypothetical protein
LDNRNRTSIEETRSKEKLRMMPSIAERLATIETTLLRLERLLLGNGQPGLIQELKQANAANQKATKRIQARLNIGFGVLLGVAIAWGALSGAGAQALELLLKSVAR